MAANQESSVVGQLVVEILEAAGKSSLPRASRSRGPENDFQTILRRDYARALDAHFSKREMRAIVMALEVTMPGLNRDSFTPKPVHDLEKLASILGADFRADAFAGPEGLAVLGFYAKKRGRPLICVNSAHHPAAVAAAFLHEAGHHLTSRLFDMSQEPVELSFGQDFNSHFDDPMELIADMVVSLAAYAPPVARWLAGSPAQARPMTNASLFTDQAFSRTRTHLRKRAGFDFGTGIPPSESLHYLAGMIHFAKLRLALLARYGL